MIDEKIFKNEERAIFALRSLYRQYGYLPFKMSKFEEYDLYVQNKDFLVSDRVITFNDTSGRLLALKPDVTLSIIKNTTDETGCKQKVCYNENVYRVSGSTHQFKEIMQTGLECIGDIDILDIFEVVALGAQSLSLISDTFALDLSHMGIVSAILDEASSDELFKKEAIALIANKNIHELRALCQGYQISEESTSAIITLVTTYGETTQVLNALCGICKSERAREAYAQLSALCTYLEATSYKNQIKLDFSVVNDMNYYNGIVFKGFLNGIPESVLSGGEYGMLLQKMGRKSNAIGFAIYLDLLEGLEGERCDYDVDTLILYDDATQDIALTKKRELIEQKRSVSAQRSIPSKLRYRELLDLREGESK
ncbi:MAG: ATP phosphoribosyltransferase regulatory subunit [Clostridia bacterium]|nr:ATP phosphoribosyltransferase regulatory subunit [Clostridia bacterium]